MCVKRTDNTTKREKIWVALLRNPYETKNRAHKILTEVEVGGGGNNGHRRAVEWEKTGGVRGAYRPI